MTRCADYLYVAPGVALLMMASVLAQGEAKNFGPYEGPRDEGVDTSTLTGKVMCGYQGWFTCEGDGAERGWFHWGGPNGFKPGSCSIDLWPDVSELDAIDGLSREDGKRGNVNEGISRPTVVGEQSKPRFDKEQKKEREGERNGDEQKLLPRRENSRPAL